MKKKQPNIFNKKRSPFFSTGVISGGVIAFIAFQITGPEYIFNLISGYFLKFIIAILPVLFFTTIIHELGHAFGGLITGERLYRFIIGPVQFIREKDRLKARLISRSGIMGGYLGIPTDTDDIDGLIRSRIVIIAMGPGFNLMSFCIFWVAGGWFRSVAPLFSELCFLISVISLISGVINLIPKNSNGFQTDGKQLITLIKKGAEAEEMVKIFHLQNLLLSGTRPRDLDIEMIKQTLNNLSDNKNYKTVFHLLAYLYYLDSGDHEQAKTHLDKSVENLEEIAKGIRPALALEFAFYEVFFNRNLEEAGEWMEQAKGGFVDKVSRARLAAAIALYEGNAAASKEKIAEARKELLKTIDKGGAYLEEDLLQQIEDKVIEGQKGIESIQ